MAYAVPTYPHVITKNNTRFSGVTQSLNQSYTNANTEYIYAKCPYCGKETNDKPHTCLQGLKNLLESI